MDRYTEQTDVHPNSTAAQKWGRAEWDNPDTANDDPAEIQHNRLHSSDETDHWKPTRDQLLAAAASRAREIRAEGGDEAAERAAELETLVRRQINDDTARQHRQRPGGREHRKFTLSLGNQGQFEGESADPRGMDYNRPPHETRYSESGAAVSDSLCDIAGRRTSRAAWADQNTQLIDWNLYERPFPVLWDLLVYEAWRELHVAYYGSDPLMRVEVWFRKYLFHPDLTDEPGTPTIESRALVFGTLLNFATIFPRRKVVWRAQRGEWLRKQGREGETLRDIARETGIPRSTISDWRKQHEEELQALRDQAEYENNQRGEPKMTYAQAEAHAERLERIERRLDSALDSIEDVCQRIQDRFPNDAEVSAAVDRFLTETRVPA